MVRYLPMVMNANKEVVIMRVSTRKLLKEEMIEAGSLQVSRRIGKA